MKRRRWTVQEVAALRQMVAEGRSIRQIAEALGREYAHVQRKKAVLKLVTDPEAVARNRAEANAHRDWSKVKRRGPQSAAERAMRSQLMLDYYSSLSPEQREARRQKCIDVRKNPRYRRKMRDRRLHWLPDVFEPDYRRLIAKKIRAADARAMLEPAIARWLATFEGQMWKVATGRARIVPNVSIVRPVAHPFSLTGGSL